MLFFLFKVTSVVCLLLRLRKGGRFV